MTKNTVFAYSNTTDDLLRKNRYRLIYLVLGLTLLAVYNHLEQMPVDAALNHPYHLYGSTAET